MMPPPFSFCPWVLKRSLIYREHNRSYFLPLLLEFGTVIHVLDRCRSVEIDELTNSQPVIGQLIPVLPSHWLKFSTSASLILTCTSSHAASKSWVELVKCFVDDAGIQRSFAIFTVLPHCLIVGELSRIPGF